MDYVVLDFESFMAISGCTKGRHTEVKPKVEPPTSGRASVASPTIVNAIKKEPIEDGKETFSSTFALPGNVSTPEASSLPAHSTAAPKLSAKPAIPVEEEDDPSIEVPIDTICKRRGCGAKFLSQEESRLGNGEASVCVYHPSQPVFHEGSKGYMCCKRRVLEFDEFLKIKGCKTGRHTSEEDLVTCRIDHYQTPTQVHVSVFAKQTDKIASKIELGESQLSLNLLMPGHKRFKRTIDLYGPIDPVASKYTFLGTKVELVLAKADKRSWPLLEKADHPLAGYNLTFGVTGRTGTIGAKEPILSEENKARLV
ncbi:hypothetical protein Clacol_006519 [Clathrus columnatus]|uniref:Cysteine and histidine-rich domain-containing protein 1 n=1 Tax=Clathrus columnatus TaxID=1419009 RepID=A0AAV5AGM1_9AGAM|nr:hypothetical protein Clacol_006519 [Clathrus columnatus]